MMGRRNTTVEGLSLAEHEALAAECAELRRRALAVRHTVREGLSSATYAYQCSTGVLSAVKAARGRPQPRAGLVACRDAGRRRHPRRVPPQPEGRQVAMALDVQGARPHPGEESNRHTGAVVVPQRGEHHEQALP